MCKHSITFISENQVIAIGGWLKGGISNRVFMGQYFENIQDVSWTELTPLKHGSSSHISFKMQGKLVVVGGWDSDFKRLDNSYIYCIQTNTWSVGPKLPYPLSHASVIVHESEKFALVFGGICDGGAKLYPRTLISFTLENGFVAEHGSSEIKLASDIAVLRVM